MRFECGRCNVEKKVEIIMQYSWAPSAAHQYLADFSCDLCVYLVLKKSYIHWQFVSEFLEK